MSLEITNFNKRPAPPPLEHYVQAYQKYSRAERDSLWLCIPLIGLFIHFWCQYKKNEALANIQALVTTIEPEELESTSQAYNLAKSILGSEKRDKKSMPESVQKALTEKAALLAQKNPIGNVRPHETLKMQFEHQVDKALFRVFGKRYVAPSFRSRVLPAYLFFAELPEEKLAHREKLFSLVQPILGLNINFTLVKALRKELKALTTQLEGMSPEWQQQVRGDRPSLRAISDQILRRTDIDKNTAGKGLTVYSKAIAFIPLADLWDEYPDFPEKKEAFQIALQFSSHDDFDRVIDFAMQELDREPDAFRRALSRFAKEESSKGEPFQTFIKTYQQNRIYQNTVFLSGEIPQKEERNRRLLEQLPPDYRQSRLESLSTQEHYTITSNLCDKLLLEKKGYASPSPADFVNEIGKVYPSKSREQLAVMPVPFWILNRIAESIATDQNATDALRTIFLTLYSGFSNDADPAIGLFIRSLAMEIIPPVQELRTSHNEEKGTRDFCIDLGEDRETTLHQIGNGGFEGAQGAKVKCARIIKGVVDTKRGLISFEPGQLIVTASIGRLPISNIEVTQIALPKSGSEIKVTGEVSFGSQETWLGKRLGGRTRTTHTISWDVRQLAATVQHLKWPNADANRIASPTEADTSSGTSSSSPIPTPGSPSSPEIEEVDAASPPVTERQQLTTPVPMPSVPDFRPLPIPPQPQNRETEIREMLGRVFGPMGTKEFYEGAFSTYLALAINMGEEDLYSSAKTTQDLLDQVAPPVGFKSGIDLGKVQQFKHELNSLPPEQKPLISNQILSVLGIKESSTAHDFYQKGKNILQSINFRKTSGNPLLYPS